MGSFHLSSHTMTGHFWFDTGLAVLLNQFDTANCDSDQVLQWLVSKLVQPTGKKRQYYDQETQQVLEYDERNWVYPTKAFIKANDSRPKVAVQGKKLPERPPEFKLNLALSRSEGICDNCGERSQLTDAKMWMFPLVVDSNKFGSFYSGTKGSLKLCPRCALSGVAGYLGWLWKTHGKDTLHFFLFHSEIEELTRLHREVLGPLRISGQKSGNAEVAFWGRYTHETTLGLLLALFQHLDHSSKLSEEGQQFLASMLGGTPSGFQRGPIRLYAVTGKLGRAFKMESLCEFSNLHRLFRLYRGWIHCFKALHLQGPPPHERLVNVFRQFEDRRSAMHETVWRDKIAGAILEFSDPTPFVEQFLFDVSARQRNSNGRSQGLVGGTLEVIKHYLLEVLKMDESLLNVLAGFGSSLGKAAFEHSEMGLLYTLRNAKNPEDFYRVLNDIQFRLEMTIPQDILRIGPREQIGDVPWLRVKTLLTIYAMNAFLRKKGHSENSHTNQAEETQA